MSVVKQNAMIRQTEFSKKISDDDERSEAKRKEDIRKCLDQARKNHSFKKNY